MEYIHRKIEQDVLKHLFQGEAVFIYGPRQAGKSTLMREIVSRHAPSDVLWLDGDNPSHNTYLLEMTIAKWQSLIGRKKIVVVDEAQSIPNIGRSLKLAVDYFKDVQILASGSSSFALRNKTSEPMTGRKFEYTLLPLSFEELAENSNPLEERDRLHFRLRYGMYPDVVTNEDDAQRRIDEISGSYPHASFQTITPENFESFLSGD